MRFLWLKTELLHPLDRGGKIRTFAMLRELVKHHPITYLTLDDGSGGQEAREKAQEYSSRVVAIPFRPSKRLSSRFYAELLINLFDPLPYAVSRYRSRPMKAALKRELGTDAYDVMVCDFLTPSVNIGSHIHVPSILFQHNVEAMIWRRHHEVAESHIRRNYMGLQWRRMRRYEERACKTFDHVIAVSETDARRLATDYSLPDVSWVPTGVDTDYFRPCGNIDSRPHDLVFTGAMDWMPNEDAMVFMVEEILPLIRCEIPNVSLTIVGRDPTPRLERLAEADEAVILTGRVDDVRPYMERAAVNVIPIRIGSGTRLKVYEAMAMEMPIVSTTVGAEGLDVEDGENILLRDSAGDVAGAVVELLRDPRRARQMGLEAAEMVRRKYGWSEVAARFATLCEGVVMRCRRS